jgi:hypothetical protein
VMSDSKIVVPREELENAFRTLEIAAKGKNPPDLIIQCHPGLLILQVGGSKVEIDGDGLLVGQARLSGKMVRGLRLVIPDEEEIIISQQQEYLTIGRSRFSCTWEEPESRMIRIPNNASLGHVLGIGQRYTKKEIEKSGLRTKFEAANREREQRINKALDSLAPLGVTHEDLVALVNEAINRLNRTNFDDQLSTD